jgi:putative membrane protein
MMNNKYKDNSSLILRDYLALDRTRLANERTMLAYARTAIMLFVSGVTLLKLFPGDSLMVILGAILLPLSLVASFLGIVRYVLIRRAIINSHSQKNTSDEAY